VEDLHQALEFNKAIQKLGLLEPKPKTQE